MHDASGPYLQRMHPASWRRDVVARRVSGPPRVRRTHHRDYSDRVPPIPLSRSPALTCGLGPTWCATLNVDDTLGLADGPRR